MRPRQQQLPPEAPDSIRMAIREALDNNAYNITRYGRDYLRLQNLSPEGIVAELCDYLDSGKRVYLLTGPSIRGIKYRCCLRYENLIIHTKMFNTDNGDSEKDNWNLILSFSEHNTGWAPLPA